MNKMIRVEDIRLVERFQCTYSHMKTELDLLNELIDDMRKELVKAEFNRDLYADEERKPKTMGQAQAKEGKDIWNQRIQSVEGQIRLYTKYRKRKYGV